MGYFKETISGVSWMGSLRLAVRGLGFVRIAILARLLSPTQFGLYGIAALVLSLLEILTETGINVYLIQLKDDIKDYINTAWIVSIARGFLISVLIFVSASFVAGFFKLPDSYPLIILVGVVPLIRGFINPSLVVFQKNLEFAKEFWLRTVIYSIDAVTVVIIALVTHSAISMVWGLVISSLFEVILSFLVIKPIPKFSYDPQKAKNIIQRGKWVTGYGIFDFLYQNVDDAIVGKLLGATSLGIYQVAYKISSLPVSEVADVFSKVTFPVYVKIGGNLDRLKKAFLKTLATSGILIFAAGTIIFIFPQLIVTLILGDNWLSAVDVLRVLALFGVLKAINGIFMSLFLSIGKQEYVTYVTFLSLGVLAITIVPMVNNFGIIGAGNSAVLGSLVSLPLVLYFTYRIFRYDTKN